MPGSATPFTSLPSHLKVETVKEGVEAPKEAKIWFSKQYSDLKGWYILQNPESFALRPTKFSDQRIRFLDPTEGVIPPQEFEKVVSGRFDVKTWKKDGFGGPMILSIEGEKSVFIKIPGSATVITWNAQERLPVFEKSWKPIIFAMNKNNIVVRLTHDIVLFLLVEEDNQKESFKVETIDYNNGFCCVHPCSEKVMVYGSYQVMNLNKEVQRIPSQSGTISNWGFFVHFFPWGYLLVPHTVDIAQPYLLNKCFEKGNTQFALLFHSPNMYVQLRMSLPSGTNRTIKYQKDFSVTCEKTSQTDIEIFMVIDGQLVRYNYSFDVRKLKEEKPYFTQKAKFKATISPAERSKVMESAKNKAQEIYVPKWTFQNTDDFELLIPNGSPTNDLGHLLSRDTVAIYDAEKGYYLTHNIGIKLTNLFNVMIMEQTDIPPIESSGAASSSNLKPMLENPKSGSSSSMAK